MFLCLFLSATCRSCEDTLDGDVVGVDPYAWGVPMTMERGSMASLDSTLRKGPPGTWRQPELPEVIAMLNYRLDPVKINAAAFLQHLTFKNDKVSKECLLFDLRKNPWMTQCLNLINVWQPLISHLTNGLF